MKAKRLAAVQAGGGWAQPTSFSKYHYFPSDDARTPSLCTHFTLAWQQLQRGNDDSPDNCAKCRAALAKSKQERPKGITKK